VDLRHVYMMPQRTGKMQGNGCTDAAAREHCEGPSCDRGGRSSETQPPLLAQVLLQRSPIVLVPTALQMLCQLWREARMVEDDLGPGTLPH